VQGAPPLPPGASLTLRGPAAGDCGGRRHGAAGAARQPAGGPALGPGLGAQVERPRGPLRRPRLRARPVRLGRRNVQVRRAWPPRSPAGPDGRVWARHGVYDVQP